MENHDYDIESYPNLFTMCSESDEAGHQWEFEISEYKNDLILLVDYLLALRDSRCSMVGFNNLGYDYVVLHYILLNYQQWSHLTGAQVAAAIYEKSMSIINCKDRFGITIWDNQRIVPQIDLFKIHHFDNMAKSTSLKMLEFNMRSFSIQEAPIEFNTWVTREQIPEIIGYNRHDVSETLRFHRHSYQQIETRRELSAKYNRNFMNHNDTKIGKDYFIMRLEENNRDSCFYRDNHNKKKPRQTSRVEGVKLNDVIFPYVQFNNPEFNRILQWMKSQTLTSKDLKDTLTMGVNTKGVFKDVHCYVDGVKYKFGTGGLHASIESGTVVSDSQRVLIDLDVTSYYPTLAIENRLFPEHLGDLFCTIYKDVFDQRQTYDKKTVENGMLKLALNGVYGDSNNAYSCFFDPAYTMAVTMNGQLLLCMLAEQLLAIPNTQVIQANTDGVTIRVDRDKVHMVDYVRDQWEQMTRLTLEDEIYERMVIRDVNNYLGVYINGDIKRKGDYETAAPGDRKPLGWHQNTSALVVAKAAEAVLLRGEDLHHFITSPERDIMDFMLRTKVPNANQLIAIDSDGVVTDQQRITRYFIAHNGVELVKLAPPTSPHVVGTFKKANGVTDEQYFQHDPYVHNELIHTKNRSVNQTRRTGIDVGWKVEICNDIRYMTPANLNHAYYIAEARKLIDIVKDLK